MTLYDLQPLSPYISSPLLTSRNSIAFGAGSLLYTSYIYSTYIAPINHAFPEPVANKLRRALFYSNQEPNPKKAIRYYREALEVSEECGLNPFSDEVLGIKLQLSSWFEKIGRFEKAIEVLERIKADCHIWIERFGDTEEGKGGRNRILKKIVGLNVKLGELYENDYVRNEEGAEKSLTEAVETVLKEENIRTELDVKDKEGSEAWMSGEEVGGVFEGNFCYSSSFDTIIRYIDTNATRTTALADHYERRSRHDLAAPLYLRALSLCPPSCHASVLMNNLSISLAQTLPSSPPTSSSRSSPPPTSRSALISKSKQWALKSIDLANSVTPPERSEECDQACAVATHNLGELAEMEGLLEEARKYFEEAERMSRKLKFDEGVKRAREGVGRVRKE